MLKKILFTFFIFALFLAPWAQTNAIEDKTNVYFFYSKTCIHCKAEKDFLTELAKSDKNIKINVFEVSEKTSADLLLLVGKTFHLNVSNVPLTIIGNRYFPGWNDSEEAKLDIKQAIDCVRDGKCPDALGEFLKSQTSNSKIEKKTALPEKLKIPFFNEIKTKNLSLPILTIVIAGLDGFNPCAMWVLLFLISLLLGMQNRKRMWILGGTFIFTSSVIYFLFLAAWLNVFLFLGIIFWVRILIGIIAIASGYYNIREYFKNRKGTCPISQNKTHKKTFDRLKNLVQEKKFFVALIGITLLAITVNIVELICSAGLPAVYTQVLSMSNLNSWQYFGYLLLYIIIFMLDDIIIFTIAMTTLKNVAFTGKYSALSKIIGGIVILLLGLLLIFKPEWIMFV
ncbi:MAG: hypothetical protein ABIF17_04440 [Patescibacteria group bacterium]